jgi:hypothetical protein
MEKGEIVLRIEYADGHSTNETTAMAPINLFRLILRSGEQSFTAHVRVASTTAEEAIDR